MRFTVLAVLLLSCTTSPDDTSEITYDVCAPITLSASHADQLQLSGIAGAMQLWAARGASRLTLASPSSIELRFEDAALVFHGCYDDHASVVYINQSITDPDTLSIVIAHELGHAFGLRHVDPHERRSLMNPGNLTVPPSDADRQALEALWGPCR
ncbi:MAG TPA: M57 family metalloprotease [Kofleriaceae bacterium]|nr:M57 family metalloprotease [Kofleriaceae bacterium]